MGITIFLLLGTLAAFIPVVFATPCCCRLHTCWLCANLLKPFLVKVASSLKHTAAFKLGSELFVNISSVNNVPLVAFMWRLPLIFLCNLFT